MKEKIFKELIEEHQWFDRSDYAKKEPLLDKIDVLNLLHQVREATIAECLQLAIKETIIMSRKSQFDLIPTDRIKLTE